MKRRLSIVVAIFTVLGISLQSMAASGSLHWKFNKIVDSSAPMPGGASLVFPIGGPSLSHDDVAFQCRDGAGELAICAVLGGTLTVIADSSTPVPGGTGVFGPYLNQFDPPDLVSLDDGIIGFRGRVGVYAYVGGALIVVADSHTPVPRGSSTFLNAGSPSVNNGGIAFIGNSEYGVSPSGVYLNSAGVISVLADTNTIIPGTTEKFLSFFEPSLSGGKVAFIGGHTRIGIYLSDGSTVSIVADESTPVLPGGLTFGNFSDPSLSADRVAFVGSKGGSSGPFGIYIWNATDGAVNAVADEMTPIPGGIGNFGYTTNVALEDQVLVFEGFDTRPGNWHGIFASIGGVLTNIIDVDDTLDGKHLLGLAFGREGLSGTSIVFLAYFADQSFGVYRADYLGNNPPVARCRNVTVSTEPGVCTASASIDNGSYDPDGDPVSIKQIPPGPYPLGATSVKLTVSDSQEASASCTATTTVVDQEPPIIESVAVAPNVLWPPNHKMIPVTVTASASDACSPPVLCKIAGVKSNEAMDDPQGDWVITGDVTVMLREERLGTGGGRVYTATTQCADKSGNRTTRDVLVTVPHARSK